MEVGNLYDNGPLSPIARIKDKLACWLVDKWIPFTIEYIEPIPRSSPFVIDMVALSGLLTIPAGGQAPKQAIAVLQMNANELLHLRWEPIDDVEGGLWELANSARFNPFGGQARVSLFTATRDPWLATTTFFILGQQKDVNIGAWNPQAIAQPTARFAFWGYRYLLEPIASGNPFAGPITYVPVSGR